MSGDDRGVVRILDGIEFKDVGTTTDDGVTYAARPLSDHNPASFAAVDIMVRTDAPFQPAPSFAAVLAELGRQFAQMKTEMYAPPKPCPARLRTRSYRWRAGTRKQKRAARRAYRGMQVEPGSRYAGGSGR